MEFCKFIILCALKRGNIKMNKRNIKFEINRALIAISTVFTIIFGLINMYELSNFKWEWMSLLLALMIIFSANEKFLMKENQNKILISMLILAGIIHLVIFLRSVFV